VRGETEDVKRKTSDMGVRGEEQVLDRRNGSAVHVFRRSSPVFCFPLGILAAVRAAVLATIVILAPVFAPGADLAMRVVEHGVPEELPAGESVVLRIVLENTGTGAWDPGEGYAVAAHLMDRDGRDIWWDGPRTPLSEPVPPGGSVTIDAAVELPRRTGPVELQWDIVQEGVRWLSHGASEPPPRHPVLLVERHAFVVEAAAVPRWPRVGARVTAPVTVRNTGAATWQPGGSFGLAAHWRRADGSEVIWEGPRTAPPVAAPSGGRVTFDAVVEMPPAPGPWLLQWDMVEEGVCWFSQVQLTPPRETVVVVLPDGAAAWPGWAAATAVLLLAVGGLRGWWSRRLAAAADLLWLVWLPWFAFAAVTEQTATGLILSAVVLASLGVVCGGIPGRWRSMTAALLGSVLVILAVADRVYLRFFGDLPSLGSLGATGQAGRLGESVLHLLDAADIGLLARAPHGVGCGPGGENAERRSPRLGVESGRACRCRDPRRGGRGRLDSRGPAGISPRVGGAGGGGADRSRAGRPGPVGVGAAAAAVVPREGGGGAVVR
jgi:hypothetical protein